MTLRSGGQTPENPHQQRSDPQAATPYADAVLRYVEHRSAPLMIPGHGSSAEGLGARLADFLGERTLQLDVPMLMEGVDIGADSPFKRSLELAAEAWGARRTWFMTNSASQANRMAAIAVRGLGHRVIVQRNAHSSFTDGVIAAGLEQVFVQPEIDLRHGMAHGITPASLDSALTAASGTGQPAHAVYVVTPSYFGSTADVRGLADVAHAHGVPLIVDNAWGPHFGFHPELPDSPARLGADLVVSSTHKLAGSLTQSAMLHLGEGEFADRLEPLLERAYRMTASTSMSALLRASLDIARSALATGTDEIGRSIAAADAFRERLRADGRFGVVSDEFAIADPLHIVIDVSRSGLSGHWVRQRLIDAHGLYVEMSTATSIVAVIGAGKVPDYDAFFAALDAIASSPEAAESREAALAAEHFPELPAPGELVMSARDAYFAEADVVDASAAIGEVSADTLAAYPPGVPNLMPGERITAEAVAFLRAVAASPTGHVRGAIDHEVRRLRVVRGV